MVYRLGAVLLVLTYISVTTALPPCVCTRELKPVCGSNGLTYSNPCLLRCAQQSIPELTLKQPGPCRNKRQADTCICTLEYRPVCGSDGTTYPNRCSVTCQRSNVEIVHEGPCTSRSKRDVCACPYNYSPVCGSDGQTYGNLCSLNCEDNVRLVHRGSCRQKREVDDEQTVKHPPCLCTKEARLVCGTDGKTYANPCLLNCARERNEELHIDYPGRCKN